MGGSYSQCLHCSKRYLSVATRCPGCGIELPVLAIPEGGWALEPGRFLSPGVLAGLLTAVAVLATVDFGGSMPAPVKMRPAFVVADSVPVVDSVPAPPVATAVAATPRPDTATVAAPPAESAGELLVAKTWTRVWNRRSMSGKLEAMLTPGDTVLADSLAKGWYRVALEGEVLGYAHRSTLSAGGPGAVP